MRSVFRIGMAAAGLCAALALAGASSARAETFFAGRFPVPHGRVSVGFAVPGLAVGAFVPSPYVGRIYYRPSYGYGFICDGGWVSVRPDGRRWIVGERPSFESRAVPGYRRGYDRDSRFAQRDRDDRFARRDRDDRGDRRGRNDFR